MPPKTIYPRTHDDPRKYQGDPALAAIRKIQSDIRARSPLAPRPYATADVQSDNDLDVFKEEKPEGPPQRPPIQALIDALDEFDNRPLSKLEYGSKEYKKSALNDARNAVNCPICHGRYSNVYRDKMAEHIGQHPEVKEYYR
jgi:hypothetical protein